MGWWHIRKHWQQPVRGSTPIIVAYEVDSDTCPIHVFVLPFPGFSLFALVVSCLIHTLQRAYPTLRFTLTVSIPSRYVGIETV